MLSNGKHQRWVKSSIDIVIALLGLSLGLIVIIPIALAILVSMGPPVLFRQQRPGLHGQVFTLLKFRTMRVAESPLPDQLRLTRLGRFLRSTSLDELPELWNVLRGDMSLVGPRPLLVEYLDHYTPDQMRRHDVRPGITGWAQINGRNAISWEEKFALDVWYVDNWSLWLDVKILVATVGKVIRREGISGGGVETMVRFDQQPMDAPS